MTMRIEGTFLRSAIARRVFFLFLLSAFVPAVMLAVLFYGHVRGVVSDYAQRQLAQAGSAHARALYDRLLGADFILNANAAQIRSGIRGGKHKPIRFAASVSAYLGAVNK